MYYYNVKLKPGDVCMKILIIEDEKLLADSIRTMLRSKGFEVDVCYDGESGADYAQLGVEMFNLVGRAYLLPEDLIDPLTSVSGCSPPFSSRSATTSSSTRYCPSGAAFSTVPERPGGTMHLWRMMAVSGHSA